MLGWALKRSLGVGEGMPMDTDDTQIEQPDTPGPVFAARAFKSALFGTPHPGGDDDTRLISGQSTAAPVVSTPLKKTKDDKGTPARPVGILLTPGTGTSRRKRVSFGREVEFGENNKKKELKIDKEHHSGRPSLFSDPKTGTSSTRSRSRPRTKLAEALENVRRLGVEVQKNEVQEKAEPEAELGKQQVRQETTSKAAAGDGAGAGTGAGTGDDDEALWEEVDEVGWDPDVTVDLNEPHSQSGRYWKAQFQNYQEDAKAEMSKLLKYKQLAKSYAKMKDAEAVDLHAKLQEEKEKVTKMEGHITELARQLARGRMKGSDHDYQELISDLTRETAMAVQYRNQVKELETVLKNNEAGGVPTEEDLDEWVGMTTPTGRRRHHHLQAVGTSPRTQRTLMETQRELRRARDQVKELTQAKEEAKRLKAELRGAEQRVRHYEKENKTLVADVTSAETAAEAAEAKAQDLEKRAKFAEDERRRKDEALRLLQRKYDSLKDDAKARVGEAEQVLRRKNEEIAELKERARQLARRSEQLMEQQEVRTATLTRHDLRRKQQQTEDDFSIRLDEPQLEITEELELPQQRLPVRTWREAEDRHDKENMLTTKSAVSAVRARPKSAILLGSVRESKKEDVLSTLRRRRGASPLRTVEAPQRETLRRTMSQRTSGEEPKMIDLVGNRFARLGETVGERDEEPEADNLADASRVSIPSERVTAALARLERRRAERRRALETSRRGEQVV